MSERNRVYFNTYEEAVAQGYIPCKSCRPDLAADLSSVDTAPPAASQPMEAGAKFVGSKNSKKVHLSTCRWAQKIKPRNLVYFSSYEEAVAAGREPCRTCKPDLAASTTSSSVTTAPASQAAAAPEKAESEYWASGKGKTFHRPSCEWAQRISESNLVKYKTRDEAIAAGKKACKVCRP